MLEKDNGKYQFIIINGKTKQGKGEAGWAKAQRAFQLETTFLAG
jgi:hypothetical protein